VGTLSSGVHRGWGRGVVFGEKVRDAQGDGCGDNITPHFPLLTISSLLSLSISFRYFLSRLKKVKKANGQVIACNEVRGVLQDAAF
jgi:hypothetical protein